MDNSVKEGITVKLLVKVLVRMMVKLLVKNPLEKVTK
jgi:hypothetical protein